MIEMLCKKKDQFSYVSSSNIFAIIISDDGIDKNMTLSVTCSALCKSLGTPTV